MNGSGTESGVFVIFGGTGDLARRKLLPALARSFEQGHLESCHVIGVSRDEISDDAFREIGLSALVEAGRPREVATRFSKLLHAQSVGRGGPDGYRALAKKIEDLERQYSLSENRVFYLAMPPNGFAPTAAALAAAGLAKSKGFTRLVVEKPFGHDLASAKKLNDDLHECFAEEQIYRIDHYLGKETVQNLLVFRFANSLFESLWNRERINAVEITVAESLGVGSRAGYYDRSGAMRDMVQNHITQLLTLVCMEVPTAFEASAIRYEKIKVLRSVAPIDCKDVVRGRYTQGEIDGERVRGYLEEEGIDPSSHTETFVALKLAVDTWRWQGVPFYLRSGKRMKGRSTTITVHFRDVPVSLFKTAAVTGLDTPDVLVITLQPDEGFSLHLDVKTPGHPFRLQRVPLKFKYKELFEEMPEAYETLLLDVWHGDQTLFVHADETQESWRIYTPLLERPPPLCEYHAGTMGPREADRLSASGTGLWTEE